MEPKISEPKILEPEILEPEILEPEILEPEILEPEILEEGQFCELKLHLVHRTKIKHGVIKKWYSFDEIEDAVENGDNTKTNIRPLKQKTNYFNDKVHGWHQEYYPNGQLKLRVNFHMGNQVSIPELWNLDGTPHDPDH